MFKLEKLSNWSQADRLSGKEDFKVWRGRIGTAMEDFLLAEYFELYSAQKANTL